MKLVELPVVGDPGSWKTQGLAAVAITLSAGVCLLRALPGGDGLAGCKDVLFRQALSNIGKEGHPEGPRAHNSRTDTFCNIQRQEWYL